MVHGKSDKIICSIVAYLGEVPKSGEQINDDRAQVVLGQQREIEHESLLLQMRQQCDGRLRRKRGRVLLRNE